MCTPASAGIVLLLVGVSCKATIAVIVSLLQQFLALSYGWHGSRDDQRSAWCISVRLPWAMHAGEEVPWPSWLAPAAQVEPLHVQKDSSQAGVLRISHDLLLQDCCRHRIVLGRLYYLGPQSVPGLGNDAYTLELSLFRASACARSGCNAYLRGCEGLLSVCQRS